MNFSAALFALLLCLAPGAAHAHPHVYIDYKVTVSGTGGQVSGLHVQWRYDAAFSSLILSDLRLLGKTALDAADIEKIRTMNDGELAKYHFYIEGVADGQAMEAAGANLAAHIDNGHLVLEFDVPLKTPAQKILFSIYDPSFYTSFSAVKDEPLVVDVENVSCYVRWKGYATPFGVMITHPVECVPKGVSP